MQLSMNDFVFSCGSPKTLSIDNIPKKHVSETIIDKYIILNLFSPKNPISNENRVIELNQNELILTSFAKLPIRHHLNIHENKTMNRNFRHRFRNALYLILDIFHEYIYQFYFH